MRKILIICTLLLVIISCNNNEKIPGSIPFKLKGTLPIITVNINGKTSKLLIDTGAFNSIIDSSSCSNLNFSIYNFTNSDVSGIGGTQKLYSTTKIETYYNGQPMYIRFKCTNLENLKNTFGVVGVLGGDYFINNSIIIDYDSRTIRTPIIIK